MSRRAQPGEPDLLTGVRDETLEMSGDARLATELT
jgi:hypothetical protein